MNSSLKALQSIKVFENVPDDQLQWFIDHAERTKLKAGDILFNIDDPIDKLFVLLKGKIEFKMYRDKNYRVVGTIDADGISGFLPYSRAKSAIAKGEVVQDCDLFILSKSCCREMTLKHYELTEVFVHEMTSRTREMAKNNVQAEKMMALGKLSAGLAHELNNPASAILRSAKELKKHLGNVPDKFKAIMSMTVDSNQVDMLNDLIFKKMKDEITLSLSQRSNLEDELEEWLEEKEVDNCFDVVDTLVDFNFGVTDLEEIYTIVKRENFSPTLNWVGNVLTTEKMVEEIEEASTRIADLVKSVKIYTHMDNAPEKQKTDIRRGIRSTLTMLNHKLKKKKIDIKTNFQEDLKEPSLMVSEVNQIWTNLIDNAIDAIDDSGIIQINAENDNGNIAVEIIDNGKGIPKNDINRIFDPFYTTKGIGEGTGMGLEVVYRVVKQHNGEIAVTSKPGETKFRIELPID